MASVQTQRLTGNPRGLAVGAPESGRNEKKKTGTLLLRLLADFLLSTTNLNNGIRAIPVKLSKNLLCPVKLLEINLSACCTVIVF
jgi:hypothetical protein